MPEKNISLFDLNNNLNESLVIKEDNKQQFGGFWTEKKLQIVRKYMETYTKALKKQAWINELVYIDGFAGSGERLDKFTGELCEGSASISLNSGFDKWHFIEKNPVNNLKLNQLKLNVENSGKIEQDKIHIYKDNFNNALVKVLDNYKWKKERALCFLDPEDNDDSIVNFSSLSKIAETKAIDVWILFPISKLERDLPQARSKVRPKAFDIINDWMGSDTWQERIYSKEITQMSLFGEDEDDIYKSKRIDFWIDYYQERLNSIFAETAKNPKILKNSRGRVLYILFFAISNPSKPARNLALKFANHLLNDADF